jgi:hypothetical protein
MSCAQAVLLVCTRPIQSLQRLQLRCYFAAEFTLEVVQPAAEFTLEVVQPAGDFSRHVSTT